MLQLERLVSGGGSFLTVPEAEVQGQAMADDEADRTSTSALYQAQCKQTDPSPTRELIPQDLVAQQGSVSLSKIQSVDLRMGPQIRRPKYPPTQNFLYFQLSPIYKQRYTKSECMLLTTDGAGRRPHLFLVCFLVGC